MRRRALSNGRRALPLAAIAGCAVAGHGLPVTPAEAAIATGAIPPSVTLISPNNGSEAGETALTLTGTGFTPGTVVRFGLSPATQVVVESATKLTAHSPPGNGLQSVSVAAAGGTSAPSTRDQYAYDPPPNSRWLGLDNNTAKYLGPVDDFSLHGIVYDRSFELQAGELPGEAEKGTETAEFERRLAEDHEDGMTPVAVIEYKGYDRAGYAYKPDPEFPQARTPGEEAAGRNTIGAYVAGFVKSASAILALIARRYPGMQVLLEPMNEPWGYTTPQYNGGEYANVIAALLPAARAAGIPTQEIYVAANGKGCSYHAGSEEEQCTADGWVPAMYRAQPQLGSEIEGWYFHPYGPPSGAKDDDSEGIETLPLVQAVMTSGQNNIMVSEVGYCAEDVNNPMNLEGGADCHDFSIKDSTLAATDLSEMLGHSRPYHEAGWLRVLIVYSRNDGGWAMESFPELTLTRSGEAFESFADVESRGLSPQIPAASPAGVEGEFFESGIPCGLCSLTAMPLRPASGG